MHTTIIVIYNHTCTCTWNAIVHVRIGLETKYMSNHLIINEISIVHKGYMWPGMRKSFTWEVLISSNTYL